MHHTLQDVLSRKSSVVAVMDANETLEEAAARMNRLNVGAMVILAGGGFVGVLSDRDVLRCVAQGKRIAHVSVIEALPNETIVAEADMNVGDAIAMMEQNRRRHLPVLSAGHPIGIVSLGDLLHFVANDLEGTVSELVTYIHGPTASVEPYVTHNARRF